MNKKFLLNLLLITFIFSLCSISAVDDFTHVVSNSEDWKDVYSTIHYANLKGVGNDFIVSTKHGTTLLDEIGKTPKIRVMTSKNTPYVFNYPDTIISKGIADADEIVSKNFNIDLIKELPEIKNFIIIDDSYGFNAIAVAPYAKITNSWVFFANEITIYEIESILENRNIENIIIYGHTDKEVKDVLSKYNPEIIDKEDRFENNIEIVKKYLEKNPTKQVILSNGEFIEKEIMSGQEPVLFTGKENVPDKIRDYIKESDIEIGVLIGNDLVGAATNIRRTAGISVMVKFARGARGQTGGVASIEGLDLFPVPTPSLSLEIHSIKYNKASSQLEVTYKSDSNLPIYLKGTIDLAVDNEKTKVGDLEAIFMTPGDYKTIIYPLEITVSDYIEASIYTLFGETTSSLDRILERTMEVETIDVKDRCKFNEKNIKSVKYSKQKKEFLIKIKNFEAIDCWADLEIENIIIDASSETIGSESNTLIPSGKTKTITIKKTLEKQDIENNPTIDLISYSGEREFSLVHTYKDNFDLKIQLLSGLTIAIILLMMITIIGITIITKRKFNDEL